MFVDIVYVDFVAVGQRLGRNATTSQSHWMADPDDHLDSILRISRGVVHLESSEC